MVACSSGPKGNLTEVASKGNVKTRLNCWQSHNCLSVTMSASYIIFTMYKYLQIQKFCTSTKVLYFYKFRGTSSNAKWTLSTKLCDWSQETIFQQKVRNTYMSFAAYASLNGRCRALGPHRIRALIPNLKITESALSGKKLSSPYFSDVNWNKFICIAVKTIAPKSVIQGWQTVCNFMTRTKTILDLRHLQLCSKLFNPPCFSLWLL